MKLSIELVPASSWYKNVRSLFTDEQWDTIRRAVYRRAEYKCEVCGGAGPDHPVECHEVWKYNDRKKTQTLIGFVALCPACHSVKHMGHTVRQGNYHKAVQHLMKINGWGRQYAEKYIDKAFKVHAKRSQVEWKLNTTYADRFLRGIR